MKPKQERVYGNQALIYSEELLRSQLSQKVYLIPKKKTQTWLAIEEAEIGRQRRIRNSAREIGGGNPSRLFKQWLETLAKGRKNRAAGLAWRQASGHQGRQQKERAYCIMWLSLDTREQQQDFPHHSLSLCRRGTVRNPASKEHRVSDLLLELQGSFMGVLSSSESWPTLQGNEENNSCFFCHFCSLSPHILIDE